MKSNTQEISSIIKEQIRAYRTRTQMTETGTVILVGDGIARVYGLRNCMSGELLQFDDGMKRFLLQFCQTEMTFVKGRR